MKTLRSIQLFLVAGVLSQLDSTAVAGDPLDQWHEVQITGSIPNQAIRYAQGKWFGLKRDGAAATSFLLASTNGRDWRIHTAFESPDIITDLEFADGLWLAVGTRQSTNVLVLTSTNAVDWNSTTLARGAGTSSGFWRIRRSPTEWILMPKPTDYFFRSTDGQNWTSSQRVEPPFWIEDIVYGDGRWIAAVNAISGNGDIGSIGWGSLAVSTNLTDWQWWQDPALPLDEIFYGLHYAHGLWFGVSGLWYGADCSVETAILSSTDGRNWTRRFSAPNLQINLVDNRVVAIAWMPWCAALCSNCPPPSVFESAPLVSLQQNQPGELTIHRAAGIPVVVESSDDLHQWQTLTNLPLGQAAQPFTDPTASSLPARFYRARTP